MIRHNTNGRKERRGGEIDGGKKRAGANKTGRGMPNGKKLNTAQ